MAILSDRLLNLVSGVNMELVNSSNCGSMHGSAGKSVRNYWTFSIYSRKDETKDDLDKPLCFLGPNGFRSA